ncbi:MAG: TVP38/TMEM64 family protein [Syntrophomonadaceae bacterium]|nr:TVP38/TMEM64 family protein [Syntrophomonadaceae bacterium]
MHHFYQMQYISEYIRSFGYLAPMVALMLFTIQAAIPVFPFAVLVAATVIIFGVKVGFAISLLGAILGSVICYWLCRKLGADWFNEKILRWWGYDARKINSGMAFGGIILAHLVPVFPSAVITMAAAISGVSFISFTAATTLGLIPATLAYTGLGWYLFHMHNLYKVVFTMVLILMFLYLCKNTVKKWLNESEKTVDR